MSTKKKYMKGKRIETLRELQDEMARNLMIYLNYRPVSTSFILGIPLRKIYSLIDHGSLFVCEKLDPEVEYARGSMTIYCVYVRTMPFQGSSREVPKGYFRDESDAIKCLKRVAQEILNDPDLAGSGINPITVR